MVPVGADAAPGGAGILASTRRRFLRIGVTNAQPEPMKTLTPSVAELQRQHVVLELECIDRMYLNAYVPKLTSAAGVAGFFRGYLGHRFASTKDAAAMTNRFVISIRDFLQREDVPEQPPIRRLNSDAKNAVKMLETTHLLKFNVDFLPKPIFHRKRPPHRRPAYL